MGYTNSPLVSHTHISPNRNSPRNHAIDTISIHCVVGQCTVETLGNIFAPTSKGASSNYGVGYDGKIGMYVEERDRSWCTSSAENDNRAVTIETASDTFEPYAVKPAAYEALIKLCADICKRNGKTRMTWIPDKAKALAYNPAPDEMRMTVHRWFDNKSCVPVDTEVLTREGWVKIGDIEIGDEIACADLDNLQITFEEVYDKVTPYYHDTYTNNGLTATKNHRLVYSVQQDKLTYRIAHYNDLLHYGSQAYIPMAGYARNDGLPMSDAMIAFCVAVQADGHYMYEKRKDGSRAYYGVEFHLRKERKISRIMDILEILHLPYRENIQSNQSTKIRIYNYDGINIVNDICEKYLNSKDFTWDWLQLSERQAKIFLDEVALWDGCVIDCKQYFSTRQKNLDIVSAIAALNGVGSRVAGDCIRFQVAPYITLGHGENSTIRHTKQHQTRDTLVTCVSVKTGIFLCRQNGKTFIIGNCPGAYLMERQGEIARRVTELLGGEPAKEPEPETAQPEPKPQEQENHLYRVRKSWAEKVSQVGAFNQLENAKKCADEHPGYSVFDETGASVYKPSEGFKEYRVRRNCVDPLNIRLKPTVQSKVVGQIADRNIYTIVDEIPGDGSKKGWGKLKSGLGWIALDWVNRVG